VCGGGPYLTDDHPATGGTPVCLEGDDLGRFKPVKTER
jgi:hypothetical protein